MSADAPPPGYGLLISDRRPCRLTPAASIRSDAVLSKPPTPWVTMKARDALWPLTQLSYVKAGNREMDMAVNLAPKDEQVRFARAVNNFHMPEIIGREEIVQADLAWLWQQVQLADTTLDVGQKQTIALYYGQTLQKKNKLNEAIQIWQAGLALAPKSEDAAALKEQLKKHKAGPKNRS